MHFPKASLYLLIALMALPSGCGAPKISDRNLVWVSPTQAQQLNHSEKKPTAFVDCRSTSDFLAGHIPGAISLPYSELDDQHARVLVGYDNLIIYGRDYGDPKAEAMSKSLLELRYHHVKTLSGGLLAWADAGYPVEVDAVEEVSIEVTEEEG
jgi:rhodanese-related sulfurtransferase